MSKTIDNLHLVTDDSEINIPLVHVKPMSKNPPKMIDVDDLYNILEERNEEYTRVINELQLNILHGIRNLQHRTLNKIDLLTREVIKLNSIDIEKISSGSILKAFKAIGLADENAVHYIRDFKRVIDDRREARKNILSTMIKYVTISIISAVISGASILLLK